MTKVPVISIIDDDECVREATTDLIHSLGYTAVAFASAEECLRSDRVNDTACLIADVKMPGMSGIGLQRHLLAQGSRLPIIFITSVPDTSVRAQARASGALGYLSKPFRDEKLIRHLDQAIAMRSYRGSALTTCAREGRLTRGSRQWYNGKCKRTPWARRAAVRTRGQLALNWQSLPDACLTLAGCANSAGAFRGFFYGLCSRKVVVRNLRAGRAGPANIQDPAGIAWHLRRSSP